MWTPALGRLGEKKLEHKNIDVNKPVENPKLVELLDQRNHISPQNEDWDSLMNNILQYIAEEGMFLAVTQFDKSNVLNHGDGTSTIQKDTVIQFESLSTNDGETYFPIYTDWKNLRENPNHSTGEIETMILTFEDVYTFSKRNTGAVLNPFSHNLLLNNSFLENMKKVLDERNNSHRAQIEIKSDTRVMLGEPKDYPITLVEAIKNYAKTNKNIKTIYLKLMVMEGKQSFLLIVDFKGDRNTIFDQLFKVAQPYIPKEMFLYVVPYSEEFGKNAADNKPFYKLEKTGFLGFLRK